MRAPVSLMNTIPDAWSMHEKFILLPVNKWNNEYTRAYQDPLSGYGGIKHCLIPAPRHVIIERDSTGNFRDYVYRNEQTVDDMLNILGYIEK